MGSTGQPYLSLPQGLQVGYGADEDRLNHDPALQTCMKYVGRGGHEGLSICLLPSDINILKEVVSIKVRLATWPPGQEGHRDHKVHQGQRGQQGHRDHQGQQGYQSHWRQAADELHRPPPTTTSFHSSAHLLGEIELNYLIHFEYPF